MVQRCCVPFCETKVGDADIKGVKVRFHRMPMLPERFQLWRAKITNSDQYKPEPELTVNSRICSKHFVKQDYLDNCQNKPVTGNHILSKDAVPSRFRWSSDNCDVSAAVPFVRRVKPSSNNIHHTNNNARIIHPQNHLPNYQSNYHQQQQHNIMFSNKPYNNRDNTSCIEHSAVEKQTQCSFEDERLKNEISRKNSIIQQLLERISQLEAEHKATTQILLKESISPVGTPTSVIKSTSCTNSVVSKDYHASSKDSISTEQINGNVNMAHNHLQNGMNPKKRKLQHCDNVDNEDENIHYVLLSLSEKVVRHDDDGTRGTADQQILAHSN